MEISSTFYWLVEYRNDAASERKLITVMIIDPIEFNSFLWWNASMSKQRFMAAHVRQINDESQVNM